MFPKTTLYTFKVTQESLANHLAAFLKGDRLKAEFEKIK